MSEGVYRALLVGNSTFPKDPHNLFELNGPRNDVALLRKALVDRTSGLFTPANVRLLANKTKRQVMQAVEQLFGAAGYNDTLLLYYSGHGKTDEGDNLFLCARDTSTNFLVSSGIRDADIDTMMRRSSARRFVIILDCCHSGGFKSAALPVALTGTGRFLLTSSRRGELSRDADSPTEPSAFTRHLVEALRAGTDHDGDGFITVNEVYDHVHDALRRETKQIPQRQFDSAIGDIELARAPKRTAPPRARRPVAVRKPVLVVSPLTIDLRDIGADDELPVEIVDVHDGSGGELDWTARSLVDWIEVTQHETYCELRLRPKPGMNRGSVHVHAARGGGSKVVRVVVEVRRRDDAPSVTVTPEELDFGVLGRASESRPQTLRIKKSTPELEVTATAEEPWIDVEQDGDVVTVSVDTGTAGDLAGKIAVRSDAGEILVPVRAVVEQGPVLEVDPPKIDFGRATEGRRVEATIRILNSGSGELTWRHRKSGAFFSTERAADTLTVTLYAVPGSHVGSISIRSNGGDAVIEVRARVTPRRASQPRRKSAVAGSTAASGKESATSGNAAAKRATARKKPVRPTQAKAKQEPPAFTGSRTPVRKQAQAKPQRAKPTPPSRSIKELLAALGPAPPPVAVEYTLEILGALKVTHALGQANGRISSTGVVVDGAGAVTVPAPFQPAEARPDPRYRAPEQRSGNAATPRSDIYSVATILYELLTGHLPSAGDRLGGRFPAPSKQRDGVPAAVDSVVLRALARDPSRRYRDAQEMAEAVLQVQASVKKHGPAQAALLASRYPRRRAAARDATGAAAAATPTRIGERRVSGLFFAERELDADEAIAWRAIVASFEVAGWLALPPTRGRVARNQSHVVMTNKRLFLAASFERATRPLRVSVPWSSITAVECVDESHDTGKWIFKERKERARVDVRVSLAPLVGPPLVQTTRPRARQPPSLTLRSHPELTIVADTVALGQTIRDQIARRARV